MPHLMSMLEPIPNVNICGSKEEYGCDFVVVQSLSRVWLFATPWTAAYQVLLSSTVSQICSNSCSLSRWCYLTISSSAALFSICLQSFPASGSFPTSRLFSSGGQGTRASASASVLPVYGQGWFPFGLTGLISLQSNGLPRVFSSTTVGKDNFFNTQSSLWSNSHIHRVEQFWLHIKCLFYFNLCIPSFKDVAYSLKCTG